jgi:L-lactate dehydrogenase complex protein LldG
MRKVSNNWKQAFPRGKFGVQFFEEFANRAKNVSAQVFRVKNRTEAQNKIIEIIQSSAAKKVVATDGLLPRFLSLDETLATMNISFYTHASDIRTHADTADVGIAGVEFGIAETGSVCEDAFAIEQRLVTTLPPLSIVLMNSGNVVPDIQIACETIANVFHNGYISFLTGPSRTSDIERVLTIGVHGPSQLIIIAVDEEITEA